MGTKLTAEQLKGQDGGAPDTVKIVADNESGYAVINADDFDAATMVKFEDGAKSSRKTR